ncbi:MAG: HAMP domain-containing protein, partial [Alphaproteobacteria bacterium]|nr:HAMP domain-containing protein [Alphaproteobacteria bacterium]
MKSIKISMQTFLMSAISVFGFLVLVAVIFIGEQSRQSANEEVAHARHISTSLVEVEKYFLEARRSEKDFFLRSDLKYAMRVEEMVASMQNTLARVDDANRLDTGAHMNLIDDQINAYSKSLGKSKELSVAIGLSEKEGLRGALRKAVHEIEELLSNERQNKLTVTMLMMRRAEKDFLLRLDPKYIDKLFKQEAEFLSGLEASALGVDIQNVIKIKLKTYTKAFRTLGDQILTLEKEKKALSAAYAQASPLLEEVRQEAEKTAMNLSNALVEEQERLFIFDIVLVLLMSVIIFVLGLFIGRGISKPLSILSQQMDEVANGNMDIDIRFSTYGNEIGSMARSVEIFRDNGLRMRQMEREKKEL